MSQKRQKRKQYKSEENDHFFYSLHSIINQMIFNRKANPSVYRRFSSLLISGRRDSVIEFILNAIISCFVKDLANEELIFSDPNSVASFFVNVSQEYPWIFANQLSDPESTKRYRMVLILRSMFSLKKDLPTINIARELLTEKSISIWESFLNRFTDIEPEIRIVCVQTAEVLLQTQIDEQIVSNLQIKLTKRFRDIEELIRSDTADAVDQSSEVKSQNILDESLMKHMIGRIGDCVFDVRKRVLICVSNVFHTIIRKYPKTEQYFFYKLPSGCLLRYCTAKEEEEKALIENIFLNNLIDISADNSVKMNNLIKLVCHCDPEAIKSISHIFRSQNRLRSIILNFILLTEKNRYKKSIIEEIEESLNEGRDLYLMFDYINGISHILRNFHHLLNCYSNKINNLKDVFESKSISCEQSMDTIEDFFNMDQEVVDSEELSEFKEQMITRCGIGLIDCNALISLFEQMKSVDQKFAKRLASLLILLSTVYTEYFNDKSVITELLHLPPVIIAFIASDSMLPFIKCSEHIKHKIKEFVAQNSNHINKSLSLLDTD